MTDDPHDESPLDALIGRLTADEREAELEAEHTDRAFVKALFRAGQTTDQGDAA